jgi:hypothetical protein
MFPTTVLVRCIVSGVRKAVRLAYVGRICLNTVRRLLHAGERACSNKVRRLPQVVQVCIYLPVMGCAVTIVYSADNEGGGDRPIRNNILYHGSNRYGIKPREMMTKQGARRVCARGERQEQARSGAASSNVLSWAASHGPAP